MKNTINELVYGFTLRIKKETGKISIIKAVYDIAVGTDENDYTTIVLISPSRPWIRVTNDHDENIPSIRIGSRERVVEGLRVEEWDKLRDGGVLEPTTKGNKFKKYFSLNLERLLEIAKNDGAELNENLINVLKETKIK